MEAMANHMLLMLGVLLFSWRCCEVQGGSAFKATAAAAAAYAKDENRKGAPPSPPLQVTSVMNLPYPTPPQSPSNSTPHPLHSDNVGAPIFFAFTNSITHHTASIHLSLYGNATLFISLYLLPFHLAHTTRPAQPHPHSFTNPPQVPPHLHPPNLQVMYEIAHTPYQYSRTAWNLRITRLPYNSDVKTYHDILNRHPVIDVERKATHFISTNEGIRHEIITMEGASDSSLET